MTDKRDPSDALVERCVSLSLKLRSRLNAFGKRGPSPRELEAAATLTEAAERIKALQAERQTMRESFEAIQFCASQGLSPGNDYRLELRLKLNKESNDG